MKKFILFLSLFLIAAVPGGTGSQISDHFYIHPFTTNQNGLFEIAEKIEKRNVFLVFLRPLINNVVDRSCKKIIKKLEGKN